MPEQIRRRPATVLLADLEKRWLFIRFCAWTQGVERNSRRSPVTKRIITLSISAKGSLCEGLAGPRPSLFLLPFDFLSGAVSKVSGLVRLAVETFLDFGVAHALFF